MFTTVNDFCLKHGIQQPDMNAMNIPRGSISKRKAQTNGISNKSYYQRITYAVIDLLRVELDDRFSESSTTLLLGMDCLDPSDSFSKFEKDKVLAMAQLYPDDYESENKLEDLSIQLENFLENVRDDSRLSNLTGVSDLCRKLVQTKKHTSFPLVFILVKLALILPVATTTVERAFSIMKIIKTDLRNRVGDDFLYHCLIMYIEIDVFQNIITDAIMHTYQGKHDRKV
jgi:hypothetical protein